MYNTIVHNDGSVQHSGVSIYLMDGFDQFILLFYFCCFQVFICAVSSVADAAYFFSCILVVEV